MSARTHARVFASCGMLSVLAGALGGTFGVVGLVGDSPLALLAFPGFVLGALGMSQLIALVFRLIPARCPDVECRDVALMFGNTEYRCAGCGRVTRVEGISGTGGASPGVAGARVDGPVRARQVAEEGLMTDSVEEPRDAVRRGRCCAC